MTTARILLPALLAGGVVSAAPAGAQDMLAAQNARRAAHCTSPLNWSSQLEQIATGYAKKLAQSCQASLAHNADKGVDVGENLAFSGETGAPVDYQAQRAVNGWYDEIKNYDFKKAAAKSPSNPVGHFTQIVSARSTQLGCGTASCQSGEWNYHYWVCNYAPHGNITGQNATNIKPVCKP